MTDNTSQPGPTRRGFLDLVLAICGAITAFAATIPALMYVWPVTKKGPGADRKMVEGAQDFAPWESRSEILNGKPVIVVRTGDRFVAYSAVCTHLGCIVNWDAERKSFLCPCHAAAFDQNGKVLDGPPPAPLAEYKVTEAGGNIYISGA